MGLYCTLLWFDNMWSFSNISLHIMIVFCSCLNPTDIARDYIDSKNNSTKAGITMIIIIAWGPLDLLVSYFFIFVCREGNWLTSCRTSICQHCYWLHKLFRCVMFWLFRRIIIGKYGNIINNSILQSYPISDWIGILHSCILMQE